MELKRLQTSNRLKLEELLPYECSRTQCFLVLGVLFLSLLDLVFTLDFVTQGGSEANPLLALALRGGWLAFSWLKIGLTVFGLMVLLTEIYSSKTQYSLALILLLYTGVLNIHAYIRFLHGKALFSFG
jgi:hypothetical protein